MACRNFKVYKNPYNGFKFHQTGPIKILNSLIADTNVGVMYGNGVREVHIENTIVDGASRDWRERLGKGCSNHIGIKHSSNRWAETPERSMAFTNVTFQNFCGNVSYRGDDLYGGHHFNFSLLIISFFSLCHCSTGGNIPILLRQPLEQSWNG